MCGGPGMFCCFRLRWSALCYVRGYCYKLGLSLFFFCFCCFFFCFFFFMGSACFIEREVVVGGRFRVSWTPRLEWLALPLAWLLEFVGLSRWMP